MSAVGTFGARARRAPQGMRGGSTRLDPADVQDEVFEVHSGHRVSTEAQSVSGRFEAFVYREEDIQQVTVYQNGDRHGAVGPWAFHQFQID